VVADLARQMNPYRNALGPIPLDHFGNDADPTIAVSTEPGSVYARVMQRIELSTRGRKEPQPE
jgi:hypothetical protein